MIDISKDPVLLKQLGRRVENLPNVDNMGNTTMEAFADLNTIGMHPATSAKFEHELEVNPAIPFHLQGSHEFDESSAMFQRKQLRKLTNVVQAIMKFWQIFPKLHIIGEEVITKIEYSEVMLLVFKALRSDFSIYEAAEQIGKDWKVDSKGKDSMDAIMFADAFFELVDLWTCDIEEKTYVSFLNLLYERITVRTIVFFDGSVIRVCLEDKTKSVAELIAHGVPLAAVSEFSHISKVVKPKIQTIGDLADANAQDVEQMRQQYIKNNNLSTQRLGAELFELITRVTAGGVNSLDSLQGLVDADPEAIDCIRAVFVRAQGISTTQQTLRHNIIAELRKFGIEDLLLSDVNMTEKYLKLFDLFCVKTGAEIAETARHELERIQRELAKHGLEVVHPNKVEEYYADVINSTGKKMVEKAKSFIENSTEEKLTPYIKTEEKKYAPIVEIKPFEPKDKDFQALIAPQDPPVEVVEPVVPVLNVIQRPKTPQIAPISVPSPPKMPSHIIESPLLQRVQSIAEPIIAESPRIEIILSDEIKAPNNESDTEEIPDLPLKVEVDSSNERPVTPECVVQKPIIEAPGVERAITPPIPQENIKVEEVVVPQQVEAIVVEEHIRVEPNNSQEDNSKRARVTIIHDEPKAEDIRVKLAKKKLQYSFTIKCIKLISIEPPRVAEVLVTGFIHESVSTITRYIYLLGLTEVMQTASEAEAITLLEPNSSKKIDLVSIVVYVIGNRLDEALNKLSQFHEQYRKPVILIGGDEADMNRTHKTAQECMDHGALYFAIMPVDFKEVRSRLLSFLEAAPHRFIIKRKAGPPTSMKSAGKVRAAASALLKSTNHSPSKLQPLGENTPKRSWLKEDEVSNASPPAHLPPHHLPALTHRAPTTKPKTPDSEKPLAAIVPHKPVALFGGTPSSPRNGNTEKSRRLNNVLNYRRHSEQS
ncbi:hypothetical protein THRCLA_11335 [Thraustotheca clavata]|uniref:Uncharacterized protein n=1 Tax=Thraustotheca clavata TaxID=74557 RepID=A0A1V9Y821_9STRA|nr:hypothetical protein THRCLA_11335 [Thraustotheca clavata]